MQNANQLEKDFMDSKEVAKLLCLKVSTIYSWIHYGQLPKSIYRKLGKKIIFILNPIPLNNRKINIIIHEIKKFTNPLVTIEIGNISLGK